MEKFTIKFTPKLEQDFDAITNKNSPFYDSDFTKNLIVEYGSLENFKESDKYKELENKYKK